MSNGKPFRKKRNYTHKNYLEQGIRGGFHEDEEYDIKKGYSRKAKHRHQFEKELFDLEEEDIEQELTQEEDLETK